MDPDRQDEVERKFDVSAATILPTLIEVEGVTTIGQPDEQDLEATYFDTVELDLARHGVTLRRRTGGDDAGWHLKLPRGTDTRTEVRQPLGPATETVPEELLTLVRALVRDFRLVPVARMSTRRLEHTLLDADGTELAQVCDDQVHTERLLGPARLLDWREWEVELVDGDRGLLEALAERLLAAGAAPSSAASKLLRTLGDTVPPAPRTPSPKQLAAGSTAQLLLTYLTKHVAELQKQDMRLRSDEPGSVHRLRIAARRLRSALKTYGPLFEVGSVGPVGEELRWLGQKLSEARDAQVLRERLRHLVATEPPELVLGPVMARIDDELRASERVGGEHALATLNSPRYFRLLDTLDALLSSPPLVPDADAAARKVLPRLLQRDAKRLRRAVREIARSEDQQHDAALHEARKKAKRMRYAAESTVPVFGKRAKKLAAAAKQVQQALGEHQDTVMARRTLREYGVRAHTNGENGFTFGRLHALEQTRADEAERDFEAAWKDFPSKDLRGWIRR
jgi:CHAD domain-containing protein